MSAPKPLLKISNIDKSFPGVQALNRAALTVYQGQAMGLVGENGAGKSTLMKILTGIYRKDDGEIEFLGKSRTFSGPKASQLAGISIIHQELNLIGELSIAENIFLGREFTTRYGNIDWKKMHAEASKLLEALSVNYPSTLLVERLSVGEQQMVEIAKALSFESRVIIMDEPTDALTDSETEALFRVIAKLKAQGRGIVYISHRLKEIFAICERVTVLRDGCFIEESETHAISENRLIEAMVGRQLTEQYPHIVTPVGSVVLQTIELCANNVEKVSFALHSGEILGISGLMGAGRTDLMKVLYGLNPVHSGKIILNKQLIHLANPQTALKNGIVYISEDRKGEGLNLSMSVEENITLSALKQFCQFGRINHQQTQQAAKEFVDLFNIRTPSIHQTVGLLSGGNQQKVAIAKGVLNRPQVLILDEPTRGVDVGARKEIYQLINQLKADGLAIILVSSDMPEVLGMSDRILTMYNGTISGEFSRHDASQEKLLTAAMSPIH